MNRLRYDRSTELLELFDSHEDDLICSFNRYVAINSPSKSEAAFAAVISRELASLGFEVQTDSANETFEGECGNLIARRPSLNEVESDYIFLSCHLDTISDTDPRGIRISDGVIRSRGEAILGADDKAALASYMHALRVMIDHSFAVPNIELVLTVAEQIDLLGSRHLDYSLIRSRRGYVYDNHLDVGDVIVSGPFGVKLEIAVQGVSGHITDISSGINAIEAAARLIERIPSGLINDETVANIGYISGGTLPSKIPDHCVITMEIRGLDRSDVMKHVCFVESVAQDIAREFKANVLINKFNKYEGWSVPTNHSGVVRALKASERLGLRGATRRTLGGADTNWLRANGLDCFTLGVGFRRIHSYDEYISVKSLTDLAKHVGLVLFYESNDVRAG